MTDGGRDYLRCSINAIDKCVYDDGTHQTRRKHLTWGSRGECGTRPLVFNPIKDLEDDHIEAVLKTIPVKGFVLETIAAEQEFRKNQLTDKSLDGNT